MNRSIILPALTLALLACEDIVEPDLIDLPVGQPILSVASSAISTPVPIDDPSLGSAGFPQIATDAQGISVAVWEQLDGTRLRILSNRMDGTTWGTPVAIDDPSLSHSIKPQVAMDAQGNAVTVWLQLDPSVGRQVSFSNRFAGNAWGTPIAIDNPNLSTSLDPQVAMDAQGNAVAVWRQQESGGRGAIYSNRFDGTAWGAPAVIDDPMNLFQSFDPQVAMDAQGNAVAVWRRLDLSVSRWAIYSNRFAGNAWGTPIAIDNPNLSTSLDPQVAMDAQGNAVAVWRQQESGGRQVIYSNRFAGTTWGTPIAIDNPNLSNSVNPQVAMDAQGNAVAVWRQHDSSVGRFVIYSNRFAGTTWGSPIRIDDPNLSNPFNLQVAMDAQGNAVAVWHQLTTSRVAVFANLLRPPRTVPEQILDLIDAVGALELRKGIETSLNAPLHAALGTVDNDVPAAMQQLEAFINHVQALCCTPSPGAKLTEAEADALIALAQEIIDALNAV